MKALTSFLLLFYSANVFAQNLVMNGSFEELNSCPSNISQITNSTGWMSFQQSPDYFHECATDSIVGVPKNWVGFQYPYEGAAYAGIISWWQAYPDTREFLAIELTEPLVTGLSYFVSFRANLAINYSQNIAINHLGAKFTNTLYSSLSPLWVDNNPHIDYPFFITDTINWLNISGFFIADSNYHYLVIGNFYDGQNTDTMHMSNYPNHTQAYYFIDSIRVIKEIADGVLSLTKEERITISPNPFTTSTTITLNSTTPPLTIQLFDATGREAPLQYHTAQQTNRTVLTIERGGLQLGVYFWVVTTQQGREVVRLMVE